jgi:hypothetical protein
VRAAIVAAHVAAAVVALQALGLEALIFAIAVALGGVGVAHPAGRRALLRSEIRQ